MTDRLLVTVLVVAALLAIIIGCLIGATPLSPGRFFEALVRTGNPSDIIVLWEIRMPRALAAFVVGASLGLAGAALQGLLRNPLAEPGVLGVSACAALGATLTLFYGAAALSSYIVPAAAIAGALVATGILSVAAIRTSSMITLILVGIGLSSFAGALMALLLNLAPNPFTLADLISWTLGSVANKSHADILQALPFVLVGAALLITISRDLAVLTLGEETASSIGVDLRRTRLFVILGTGLVTGSAVSIAGAIGFVGIVAPHLIRPFVDHNPARLMVPSALLGGIILVLADIGIRLLPTPYELRLGVMAALIGAPAFVWIAMKRQVGNG